MSTVAKVAHLSSCYKYAQQVYSYLQILVFAILVEING